MDPLSPGGGKKGVGTADTLGGAGSEPSPTHVRDAAEMVRLESSKAFSGLTDVVSASSSLSGGPSLSGWSRLEGPVSVAVVFTFDRPKSAPKSRRVWPVTRSSGDVDKLLRAVLDALVDAGVMRDDSQVVRLTASKVHVGDPWALHIPGACVTVRAVGS
ncbi:endodeoxyribonuclease RusA [Blastococcus saxobsidens]|uniref:Endodeoxyribonuclease RusA n=1 Tax=Blastococcus saxobsidens TaxID=138336 RepID=A0A4Q7Y134_9ACTN|nr:endodeoxyribonuclease RusA [Blastococcus saxobsidens]